MRAVKGKDQTEGGNLNRAAAQVGEGGDFHFQTH